MIDFVTALMICVFQMQLSQLWFLGTLEFLQDFIRSFDEINVAVETPNARASKTIFFEQSLGALRLVIVNLDQILIP